MWRKRIGVFPQREFTRYERLWKILSRTLPVSFEGCPSPETFSGDALVRFESKGGIVPIDRGNAPQIVFVVTEGEKADCGPDPIRFGDFPWLHKSFRARQLPEPSVKVVSILESAGEDKVVASKGGHNLWIRRVTAGSVIDFVSVPPPQIQENSYVFEHFRPEDFFSLLPLLHFLRCISVDPYWEAPQPRACFMFDDPNLRQITYGHINYAELAQHAERNNYHVSFATIPLDVRGFNTSAVGIFQDHASRLSLLVHGNNHIKWELALNYSDEERFRLLAQALRRIAEFERKSGLEVSRVMAAPHGACTEAMMGDMARIGFEAASISFGSLRRFNRDKSWTRLMGLGMVETVAGLPVIPRVGFTNANQTHILLHAFLDQPIILMGHHQDVAGGLDRLKECAGWVNSLGDVQWTSMNMIARSNFYTRREGETLHAALYTRLAKIGIPDGVTSLKITSGLGGDQIDEPISWKPKNQPENCALDASERGIALKGVSELEIARTSSNPLDQKAAAQPQFRLWPVVRRYLSEQRDRLAPANLRLKRYLTN